MRFVDLLAFICVQTFLACVLSSSLGLCGDLYQKRMEKKLAFESSRFISESFRETSCGRGFDSFVEWQKTCKALWKLDYISCTRADSFMLVENSDKGDLFYAKWIGPYGDGEVYSRVRKSYEK